jgi:hypothetical protein
MNTNDRKRKATDLVEAGIAALKSGRKTDARFLLEQALEVDPQSEQSWLWLSGAVDTDEERRFCLTQVLSINEWNPAAEMGVKELGPGPTRSPITLSTTTTSRPAPPAAEAPAWAQWRDQATLTEAATEPTPPTAEAPALSQWRQQATSTEAATTPESPTAEAPAWSQWRDQAVWTEATATPEPPAAEAPARSRWEQQAASTEPTRGSLPKAWLVVAAILAAGLVVGLAMLFVIGTGILGR